MREIAIATAASGVLIALAVGVTGRLQVTAYGTQYGTRTIITNTWTGGVQGCTTVESKTACAWIVAP